MYAERSLSATFSVLIVDEQELVREALAALCLRIRGAKVVALAHAAEDLAAQWERCRPDLILWSVSRAEGFFDAVELMAARCAPSRIVLLDERTVDAHARQALRLEVAGYLTRQQSLGQLEQALREAHGGGLAFVPEISARLQFTNDGMRLETVAEASPLARLTAREMDMLVQISQGLTVKECARALGISVSTADNHKARLMRKLDLHKAVDLTRLAIAHGLLPAEGA